MEDDVLDPLGDIGRSVASPFEPDCRGILEQLFLAATRADLRAFVDGAPRIARLSGPLLDVLERLLERLRSFEQAWHPAFGALLHVRRSPTPSFVTAVAVELAAHAHAAGLLGAWSVHLPEPTRIALPSGALGAITSVEVESGPSGGSATVIVADGERRRFPIVLEREPWARGERQPIVATAPLRTAEDDAAAAPEATLLMRRWLASGLASLEAASPPYASWVRGIVRRVVPLEKTGPEVRSWSSAHYPGQVSMTVFDSPLDMAETLTHEASHQYFHLLDRCFPLLRAGASSQHYSPVKQAERPLQMILLAFHAFGNVTLLFDELHARGALAGDDYLHHQRDLADWLPAFVRTLSEAPGLTMFGEVVWQTLWARSEPVVQRVKEALS